MVTVNRTPYNTIPKKWAFDKDIYPFILELLKQIEQLRNRTGGDSDAIDVETPTELSDFYAQIAEQQGHDEFAVIPDFESKTLGYDIPFEQIQNMLYSDFEGTNLPTQREFNIVPSLLEWMPFFESQAQPDFETISITADYTTTGSGIVICNNSSDITITLNALPDEFEDIQIKRKDALVTISGAIDGETEITLPVQYDAVRLVYSKDAAEWGIM